MIRNYFKYSNPRTGIVARFHDLFNHPISDKIKHPEPDVADLRVELLREEFNEYLEAVATHDLVEIADALADMIVIIEGTALAYGIPIDDVFTEVMRANFSKLGSDGSPIYREDGKIMKGPNYHAPDILQVLRSHRWEY